MYLIRLERPIIQTTSMGDHALIPLIIHVYRRVVACWIDIPCAYVYIRDSTRIRDQESGSETDISSSILNYL